jgi:hypothetical protein
VRQDGGARAQLLRQPQVQNKAVTEVEHAGVEAGRQAGRRRVLLRAVLHLQRQRRRRRRCGLGWGQRLEAAVIAAAAAAAVAAPAACQAHVLQQDVVLDALAGGPHQQRLAGQQQLQRLR